MLEKPKPELTPSREGAVLKGNSVTLSCTLKLQSAGWKFYWIKPTQSTETETETDSYIFRSVRDSDGGQYRCRAGRGNPVYYTHYSDALWVNVTDLSASQMQPLKEPHLAREPLLISLIRVGQAQAVIKPVLSVEPNSPQIFRGETVTLTCSISGWSGPYCWNKDRVYSHRSAENYYTIKVDQSHKYSCYGSIDGRSTLLSNEVTLSVIERPKAVLTLQPDGQIFSGQEVTFTCEIRGHADTEWMYNWNKDGVQISSYTENSKYSFTPVESLSAKYTCSGRRRSDSQTSETSNTVTLTVSEKPKPTVRVNPQSSVYTGDRVTLNCNLLSNGWTFLWYKDRVQVAEDTNILHDTVSNAGETVYQCKARRGNYDSELSDPVTVTVRALPKPVVSINPDEQVYRGETVTLRCDLQDEEDSDWIYSWNKDGSGVSSEQEYRISSAETSHAGKYTCRGRERGGSHSSHTSDAVTLTVSEKPKPEPTPSREGAVLKGNSVTLSCTLKLQSAGWKFYWIKPTQSTETETETDYYVISSVRVSDGGQYRCKAGRGNPVYYTHYSDALWVNVTERPKAVLTLQADGQIFSGQEVTFTCEIRGHADTEWMYNWYKDGVQISSYTENRKYSFTPVESLSTKYTCSGRRRSDSQTSETSNTVTLTVSGVCVCACVRARACVCVCVCVYRGETVTLRCDLQDEEDSDWIYSWNKDGSGVSSEQEYRISSAETSHAEKPKPELTPSREGAVLKGNSVTLSCTLKLQSAGWKFYWIKPTQSTETETETETDYYNISSVRVSDGEKRLYMAKETY
ncbi:carcinoembryonic antigen-related cell adhesion molecule 5-like [Ictalurus furcatus]|uniref:carcinoembryonic antigen-related cell adhesion molecule 5-like n=1 Tax=Ictalurus furcatus TaxID=66913 RepID=UPI0023505580|nr:carcinoembryonic antigen-related cell adhesion molecule 5-like [Ictalurus furcatus]